MQFDPITHEFQNFDGQTVRGEFIIESDGWSGRPYIYDADDPPTCPIEYEATIRTSDGTSTSTGRVNCEIRFNAGWSSYNGSIIGIALEDCIAILNEGTSSERCYIGPQLGPEGNFCTWGGVPNDTSHQNIYGSDIQIRNFDAVLYDGSEIHNSGDWVSLYESGGDYGIRWWANAYPFEQILRYEWAWREQTLRLKTDLPIFQTHADLMEYVNSGGTYTDKILNIGGDPEEEYNEQFDFWFVKNKWGHNTRNVDSNANTTKNYRFYPKRKGICFIKHTPTASEPYDRILYNYSGYEPYYAAWGETADEDFAPNPGTLTTHFLSKSISFGPNDYYTKFDFDTNIPLWNTQQDADDYFNGLKDINEADNYAYIARQDNAILNPDLPGTDIDESTTLGTNGMRYSYGNRLYEITNVELSNLMTELFQPATVQSVIDGNKLFGSNTMEAVSGVIYIPLTSLDAVCDLGSLANVRIGSWESQQAQGRRIIKNEGTIDCGTFFYNRTYNDYRDYEPYNLLFANLPFCGCHQLTISKYIDKTVGVSYNIDITTGAIVCKLTADGLLVDIFDGTCGASRPISATDNNAYINNVVSAITGASSQASGAIEGITNTVGVVGKATSAGAVAAGGAALGGALFAGGIAASGVYTAYQLKNAVDNPPQMHRGSLVGNLAYNLNTKPTFLFYSKRTIRPENELAVVGYPSGHGGTIGTFNGFLSCGAVKLANFNGTKAEEAELFEILKGGIYI